MFKKLSNTTKLLLGAGVIGVAYYFYNKNKKDKRTPIMMVNGNNSNDTKSVETEKSDVIEQIKAQLLDPNKKIHGDIRGFVKMPIANSYFNRLSLEELIYMNNELDGITYLKKQATPRFRKIFKKLPIS